MDPRSRFSVDTMRSFVSLPGGRALLFSLVAELTFVILFVVNYSQLIVSSVMSLDSVPILGTITDRIGANSASAPVQMLVHTFSPMLANAFATSFVWSVLNAAILVAFGVSQYRN